MTRFYLSLFVAVSTFSAVQAQLATSLKLNKSQYVAGESVMAEVTITNHSGQELTLASTRQMPWLDFVVTNTRGNPVTARRPNSFGAMKIKAGQSLARTIDLTEHFHLTDPGNFAVSAMIRVPTGLAQGSSTNRVLFNLNPGRRYWAQKIGVSDGGRSHAREFRVLTFSGGQKSQLYAQVVDGHSGMPMRTFLLGDAMMLRNPMVTIDGKQRMHVMFLATPSMWVHCQINADGQLVKRDIHQRAAQGDPMLIAFEDGSVRVGNSIPYNAEAAAAERAKIRRASERPPITFD